MAVVTVSKIQVRSGYQEDLPALDTGEFGWCVDTQRLFIGKGTLAEGSPTIGVTEILTEYSSGQIQLSISELTLEVANVVANVTQLQGIAGNLTSVTYPLYNNQSSLANLNGITVDNLSSRIFSYSIQRNFAMRVGTISATYYGNSTVSFNDFYTETESTGITLFFTGNTLRGNAVMGYTSTDTGIDGNITLNYTDLRTIV